MKFTALLALTASMATTAVLAAPQSGANYYAPPPPPTSVYSVSTNAPTTPSTTPYKPTGTATTNQASTTPYTATSTKKKCKGKKRPTSYGATPTATPTDTTADYNNTANLAGFQGPNNGGGAPTDLPPVDQTTTTSDAPVPTDNAVYVTVTETAAAPADAVPTDAPAPAPQAPIDTPQQPVVDPAPAPVPQPPTPQPPSGIMTVLADPRSDKPEDIVAYHNAIRNQYAAFYNPIYIKNGNAAPLTWSSDLAAHAVGGAQWAASQGCVLEHNAQDLKNRGEGENLYLAGSSAANAWVPMTEGVHAFASEGNLYMGYSGNNANPTAGWDNNGGDAGHFTALVWAKSTQVGCGTAKCDSVGSDGTVFHNTIVSCRYSTPGNFFNADRTFQNPFDPLN
ncbi:hypothetical protein HDU76_007742 [Blyttiomyces sp. JEL0837]|nr:hypothetical protein HDU76_007742 [Blyttiomyces sp. JEL0837]